MLDIRGFDVVPELEFTGGLTLQLPTNIALAENTDTFLSSAGTGAISFLYLATIVTSHSLAVVLVLLVLTILLGVDLQHFVLDRIQQAIKVYL